MSIYCIHEFLKNKDFTEINTRKFNEATGATHPQISLCHRSFLEDKLNELGEGINGSTYGKFLGGLLWNDKMVNLNIDKSLFNLENLIIDSCIQSSIGGPCENKGIFSSWTLLQGYRCLSFQYPEMNEVEIASVWFKSPTLMDHNISELRALVSFPNQIMNSAKEIVLSLKNYSDSKVYEYNIMVTGVEFSRRRDKSNSPCLEVERYDLDTILEKQILSSIGCRPFYLERIKKYPPCTSQAKMKKVFKNSMKLLTNENVLESVPPSCVDIEKVVIQDDVIENDNDEEIGWFENMKDHIHNNSVWFRVSVIYEKQTYREIRQVRAYSVQSLVGNVGGYIGLFVGYSLLQIPELFKNVYNSIIKK